MMERKASATSSVFSASKAGMSPDIAQSGSGSGADTTPDSEAPDQPEPCFIGINMPSADGHSSQLIVDCALEQGYDMITATITNTHYRQKVEQSIAAGQLTVPPPSLDDVTIMPGGSHVHSTVVLASAWIELDAKNEATAAMSLQVLKHELAYASYCGVAFAIIPGPKSRKNVATYAHAVAAALKHSPCIQVAIHLPFAEADASQTSPHMGHTRKPSQVADPLSIWEVWHSVRTMAGYPSSLSVALQLPRALPPLHVIDRWMAEPISFVCVSAASFIPNPKGYPVFSKSLQQLLLRCLRLKPLTLLQEDAIAAEKFRGGEQAFLIYLRYIYARRASPSAIEKFSDGYHDFLQAPLQPLADNLENGTYEAFEQDPVKYALYEEAIGKALVQLAREKKNAAGTFMICVAGAGRGPLVDRTIAAATATNTQVKIVAVEKNPAAHVQLLQRSNDVWSAQGHRVEVVLSDMRTYESRSEQFFDLIISELLGSFGDNELSPESLDPIQRLLHPTRGIMIPQSYTAFAAPALSPKLYNSVLSGGPTPAQGPQQGSGGHKEPSSFNTPYVVMLKQVDVLAQAKPLWSFAHPGNAPSRENTHNTRFSKTTFEIPAKACVHGIAGYFEAVLFQDVSLSTVPHTQHKSPDMLSWFPIWFPLKTPLNTPDHSEVDLCFWRKTDGKVVWYEWAAETFFRPIQSAPRMRLACSEIHNVGRESVMRL
ncbi:Protein arginine N-methyltransferase skb1 [Yarrowia sp. B02]|nr:Protein arginine N-methyltransferase skb1 [Yarrowia sp. B02]